MTNQILIRPQPSQRRKRRGAGEVAGGAAAECTAVCCCCPCAILDLVVLAVYRVPAGLFRKALNRRRRHIKKNGVSVKKNGVSVNKNDVVLLQPQRSSSGAGNDFRIDSISLQERLEKDRSADEKSEEVTLEKEMWARFAGTGFWRSDSQRLPWLNRLKRWNGDVCREWMNSAESSQMEWDNVLMVADISRVCLCLKTKSLLVIKVFEKKMYIFYKYQYC